MKKVVTAFAVAALCLCAWAADNTTVGIQPTDNTQSHRSELHALDAMTIPQMLSYQGKLTDTLGVPVPDGNYQLTFRLYPDSTGGSAFWSGAQTIPVRNGLFSALLGVILAIPSVPDAGKLCLGLQVAAGPELSPRLRIVSAAYAYLAERAANADLLQGRDTAYFAKTAHTHPFVDSARVAAGSHRL